jgi:apolipoprotein N-acyltransferase
MFFSIISAIMFNLAFFCPAPFGWLILFFLFPLGIIYSKSFYQGFFWGIMVFAPHFIWLLVILITKAHIVWFLAGMIYILIVIYFSLTSGLWLLGTHLCIRYCEVFYGRYISYNYCPSIWWVHGPIFCLGTIAYYWFIEHWSLIILGRVEGYPFLNPLIPLADNHVVLWLVAKFGFVVRWMTLGSFIIQPLAFDDIRLKYMRPLDGVQNNAVAFGQQVYHTLNKMNLCPIDCPHLIVTPESFYPFALNKHLEQIVLWSSVIPDNVGLVVGTQINYGKKNYQSAYFLINGLIKQYYVKHHCVPFVEKIPKFWQWVTPLRSFFLKDADEFSKGRQQLSDGVFEINNDIHLIPQICSEFFFKLSPEEIWFTCKERPTKKYGVLLLINDSWFISYFQDFLHALTKLKGTYLGVPVIYVGHYKCCWYTYY